MAQYTRLQWEGRRLWTSRGRRRAARGVELALEHVLEQSNRIVPLDDGVLERSGRVAVDEQHLTGVITYDTPYAVRQHEELSWKHAPGRQAKYLETAMNNNRDTALRIMANEVRIWLRG